MHEEFSNTARKVMQLATSEAMHLNHDCIGTEHVLLGLLKEWSGVTPSMKNRLGDHVFDLRSELYKRLDRGTGVPMSGKLPRTPETDAVLEYAVEESQSSMHACVEAEHILLGLLRESEGIAGEFLRDCGCEVEELRKEITSLLRQPNRIEQVEAMRKPSDC